MAETRSILLAGATGLVGGACLRRLGAEPFFAPVRALVRRTLADTPGRIETVVADFDRLEAQAEALGVETVICALGTTIKKAGSQEAFRRVDFEYPLSLARLARTRGARHFLVVSALGAEARSRVFYNRVKGELEDALRGLGYPSLTIVRPSLLLGSRGEFRLGEVLAKPFACLAPRRWRGISAERVAEVLVTRAREQRAGEEVIENAALHGRG